MNLLLFISVFILRTITIFLAGFVFYKAYLKHKKARLSDPNSSSNFLIFGLGIFIYSLADFVEEVLFEFTNVNVDIRHTIAAIISLISFSLIFHSIHKS